MGLAAATPALAQDRPGLPERAPYPERWEVARPAPIPPPVGKHVLPADRQEIQDLLRLGAFAILEDEFTSLRASVRRDIRWEDQLADSYLAFGGPDDDLLGRLDEWVQAYGGWSPAPYVARALYWWARAEEWERERLWRGNDQGAAAARDDAVRRGRADARQALALDPYDLGGHLALFRLDEIFRLSESSLDIIGEALARFPDSYRLRWEALWQMRPAPGESYQMMQAVVDEAETRVDANPRLAQLRGSVALAEAARLRERRDYAGALRKLDEAETLGAPGWLHHERAITWSLAGDPTRALAAANLAVAADPAMWQMLDDRARILAWIARFATLVQLEPILAQALADQDDALALQPGSYVGLERRAWIASFHADCAHSTLRCFSHATIGVDGGEPSDVSDPASWWVRLLMFVVGIPLTLLLVLIEGDRLYLLPVPLAALWAIGWNFVEWRRHRYWVPRVIHVMAVVAFVMIVAINVAWVRAGGSMWVQRYVVIFVCTVVPYFIYLTLGGPRYMSKRGRVPAGRRRNAAGGPAPIPGETGDA